MSHAKHIQDILSRNGLMIFPPSYYGDQYSPLEELRHEQEQAEAEDREEEIFQPTEDER